MSSLEAPSTTRALCFQTGGVGVPRRARTHFLGTSVSTRSPTLARCVRAGVRGIHASAQDQGQGSKAPKEDRDEYAHLDPSEREHMMELDALAEGWIGSSIARWEWYERIKCRRKRMLENMRDKEENVEKELAQLTDALKDLDSLLGTALVDVSSARISPLGWSVVSVVVCVNVFVIYAAFEIVTNVVNSAFPAAPF